MAKSKGAVAALYIKTTSASVLGTGLAMEQVGTSLWYKVTDPTKIGWDRSKAQLFYDGVTPIYPVEIDHTGGYIRLAAAPSGAVTATVYYFALAQWGGFNSFGTNENMNLEEDSCFEDDPGANYEGTQYAADGQGDGFYSTVDSKLETNHLRLISKVIGTPGDNTSLEIQVAGSNTPLSVSVATAAIVVASATGSGGAATSTARDIRDAINAHAAASALVYTKLTLGEDGSAIPGALAHTHLSGGVNPAVFDKFADEIPAILYWDASAPQVRTVGIIQLQQVQLSLKSVKSLIGKSVKFKFQGMCYDYSG